MALIKFTADNVRLLQSTFQSGHNNRLSIFWRGPNQIPRRANQIVKEFIQYDTVQCLFREALWKMNAIGILHSV